MFFLGNLSLCATASSCACLGGYPMYVVAQKRQCMQIRLPFACWVDCLIPVMKLQFKYFLIIVLHGNGCDLRRVRIWLVTSSFCCGDNSMVAAWPDPSSPCETTCGSCLQVVTVKNCQKITLFGIPFSYNLPSWIKAYMLIVVMISWAMYAVHMALVGSYIYIVG